jgi:predicted butyrate kinase (DUF1464 family)
MKKILLFAILAIALAGCKSEKEYQKKIEETLDNMSEITMLSAPFIDGITDVWSTAIYDNMYNGGYCSDFKKALADYIPKLQAISAYAELKQSADNLSAKVKELNDYPSKYKEAYNELAELTPLVYEFFQLASNPEGSLTTYSTKTKELYTQIGNKISSMKLKYVE